MKVRVLEGDKNKTDKGEKRPTSQTVRNWVVLGEGEYNHSRNIPQHLWRIPETELRTYTSLMK